ncbi:putative phosphate permease [Candidatus Clavichlamydia salmonicola]|uniref:inorganic phosphate transporter n=1 Tax=Candidatus Clavichlamydia salmonicola TaxID=469812 RepID=UPI001890F79B|nr:inorganic phosphate transporter [Candidatus Clavichlamydia salmonicola]MBF5050725.1 putative phosphate permease [Candidatus Clavichlamydia salmonicola]
MSFLVLLLVLAGTFGFYAAWSIGANDVANAVGTSVGSGALSLKKAVLLAIIFESAGAFFLGGKVAGTIEYRIVGADLTSIDPMNFVYGMLAALLATGGWLQIATFFKCPVSTTQAVIGAVIGFGIAVGNGFVVYWGYVGSIVLGWIISPLLGGCCAYAIFSLIRKQVLYKTDPVNAMRRLAPTLVTALFVILTGIILFKDDHRIFSGIVLMAILLVIGSVSFFSTKFLLRNFSLETIQNIMEKKNKKVSKRETYYSEVERIFGYLQVITACFMAFGHGSNDVANAIGPVSAIFKILKPSWNAPWVGTLLLGMGGIGIVVGLVTWGWRVIETVGKTITELTPSRGFAAGFGSALTVVLASKIGLPISTTHVVVGSVLGVGFARGIKALNMNVVRDIFVSWVITVPVSALLSMMCFLALKYILGQ